MPWRLIGFILLFGIFVVFIAFNLGNTCDINLIFHSFSKVPVFLTALVSFVLGMLGTLPFTLSIVLKKKTKAGGPAPAGTSSGEKTSKAKKKLFKKDKKAPAVDGDLGGDNGPYGIN
jgi:uncharacterized integral membrane protein